MLCSFLALGKIIDSFVVSLDEYSPSKEVQKYLIKNRKLPEAIGENNKENIEMLQAVISKCMKDDISIGTESDCINRTSTMDLLTI